MVVKEEMLNAVTAISGSGPGYLYDWGIGKTLAQIKEYALGEFTRLLTASAKDLSFSEEEAILLAQTTAQGSFDFL